MGRAGVHDMVVPDFVVEGARLWNGSARDPGEFKFCGAAEVGLPELGHRPERKELRCARETWRRDGRRTSE